MIVNTDVPVATETNLVNTKFNEIQQVKPKHLLNEPLHYKLVVRPEEIIPKNLPIILFFYSQNIYSLFLYYSKWFTVKNYSDSNKRDAERE